MTYQETLDWLFAQLPAYQKIGKSAYKADLSNIIALANYLDNPQNKFKSIHVAGTNGKGSSSHMLAAVLQQAGYKVGLYTSPHLKDFRERIKINGNVVSQEFVVQFIARNQTFFEANSLSFFEMTVGMAFEYFAEHKVDIAIIEVGLGGRLDATNIITPEVSLITNIGFDHTQFLGNTLESIAKEKGGIIKNNVPVVISETQNDTKEVFIDLASKRNSLIVFADTNSERMKYQTDLLGSYQQKNMNGVVATLACLKGFVVSQEDIVVGLQNVVGLTNLLGRWQILNDHPKTICDTAHNCEGLTLTMKQLLEEKFNHLHIVFGMVADKDVDKVLTIMPSSAQYYFCAPNSNRKLHVDDLLKKAFVLGLKGKGYQSVNEAYMAAKEKAILGDCIYIGGSTFVVAEIL
ncbi:bifunctional folylpolyglutamate synthase/dihydrofolate synthase [Pseudofulvibacter geojedonensis]|uniref:Dihydrofolate synthase/folylpolyglutamate synthase n=1 Tax=Pseudofulvibacter geojedonensis TaxID=1123758 RepID=A0ABW3I4B4_9FLAO